MRECIYCGDSKEDKEFTLEHVIPQSLGGACAPDELKTRDVCKDCNSNLGLFVDASFEKNHFVSIALHLIARNFFDPANPTSLPLYCLGDSKLVPPGMTDTEICELWGGPFGERIYWIRPIDKRMETYAGGNPRTTKQKESRAYFRSTKDSEKNIELVLLSFKDAFGKQKAGKKKRKVKKLFCTTVEGCELEDLGFSTPNELDRARISYFLQQAKGRQQIHGEIPINVNFDQRFASKLALGLSHVLFNGELRNSKYSKELRKGLWFGFNGPIPEVPGAKTFSSKSDPLVQHTGVDYGVTITFTPVDGKVAVILNIGRMLAFTVMCADLEELSAAHISQIEHGLSLVLIDPLQKNVRLTTPELITHNSSMVKNSELSRIEKIVNKSNTYFRNL